MALLQRVTATFSVLDGPSIWITNVDDNLLFFSVKRDWMLVRLEMLVDFCDY